MKLVTAVAVIAGVSLPISPVAAVGAVPGLGLTPVGDGAAYFSLTLAPGAERRLEVEAGNFGGEPVAARTYAGDVYSIVNGGFGVDLYGAEASGATRWLSYGSREIMLEPRQGLRIPFDVRVPAGTPPGEYIAALVIENVDLLPGSGPVALDQVTRNAIAVAIDVPGPRSAKLQLGGVTYQDTGGRPLLAFEVTNPGNVHLRPAGSFRVMDRHRSVIDGTAAMDWVYAGTATVLEGRLKARLAPGDYCAELSMTDSATGAHDETICLGFTVAGGSMDGRSEGDHDLGLSLPTTSVLWSAAPLNLLVGAGTALVAAAITLVLGRRRTRTDRGGVRP